MKAEKNVLQDIANHRYSVRLARTEAEIEEALKLRYEIFYKELNREFSHAKEIDKDKFDDQCHHLIVIENKTGKVIGTYRLQTFEQAVNGEGFYSETLFNLEDLPKGVLRQSFEVGRACIDGAHRNGRVLFLLWKGFAGYLQHFNKRYLLGSLGIPAENNIDGLSIYNKFEENNEIDHEYLVSAKAPYKQKLDLSKIFKKEHFEAPQLLQNYLDIGCKIISKPAYHEELKLLYVMIFLDIEDISPRTRKMFFGT